MKKEKPILFNTAMVQAILEGRKNQTRRVIKPQPLNCPQCDNSGCYLDHDPSCNGSCDNCPIPVQCQFCFEEKNSVFNSLNNSKYQKGDRLWIRETFAEGIFSNMPVIEYKADKKTQGEISLCAKWKPSIFMPKKYARIWLEVKDVRIERIQDITEEDAIAEGVKLITQDKSCEYDSNKDFGICPQCGGSGLYNDIGSNLGVIPDCDCVECNTHKKLFNHLWNSINKKRGYSWESNPWVWVIEWDDIKIKEL